LGVIFNDYPTDLAKPVPYERPDGFVVQLQIGRAYLNVMRYDDPARAARSLTDADYRQLLRRELEQRGLHVSEARLTKLGGQAAWLVTGAQTLIPGRIVSYECFATVIVSHQLINAVVSAVGSPGRPADFDLMLKILLGMAFEPVDRSAVPAPVPAASNPDKMPRFLDAGDVPIYSEAARVRGLQGTVDASFSIDEHGRAQHIEVFFADYAELAQSIPTVLEHGRFKIPADWTQAGSQGRRFTMEFNFVIVRAGDKCPDTSAASHIAGAEIMEICNSLGR